MLLLACPTFNIVLSVHIHTCTHALTHTQTFAHNVIPWELLDFYLIKYHFFLMVLQLIILLLRITFKLLSNILLSSFPFIWDLHEYIFFLLFYILSKNLKICLYASKTSGYWSCKKRCSVMHWKHRYCLFFSFPSWLWITLDISNRDVQWLFFYILWPLCAYLRVYHSLMDHTKMGHERSARSAVFSTSCRTFNWISKHFISNSIPHYFDLLFEGQWLESVIFRQFIWLLCKWWQILYKLLFGIYPFHMLWSYSCTISTANILEMVQISVALQLSSNRKSDIGFQLQYSDLTLSLSTGQGLGR